MSMRKLMILAGLCVCFDMSAGDNPASEIGGDSRFGVNGSQVDYIARDRQIGFRLVRFENMKWFMCSKTRGQLEFNGSIGPWFVNHDELIRRYVKNGLEPIPLLLGIPPWASSRPLEKRNFFYPPTNPEDYRDFTFQVAARYGSRKHPAEKLLPQDRRSGLNQIHFFEIWNEPDLNHPEWGALVGSFNDYYPILRAGYEGVKHADPDAMVLNGGLAGFHLELWEEMRKFKYVDGKSAIDFIDIMNIHYYCGKRPPELRGSNTNLDRSGNEKDGLSFAEEIEQLKRWRDQYKPKTPIWITEMGWDTIGGHFVSEKQQAAYLVRAGVIALAGGIDKFFIYRESDSGNTLYASCGFFRQDGSPKPSSLTVANFLRQIHDYAPVGRVPLTDPALYAYLFRRIDGNYLLIVWSVDAASDLPDDCEKMLELKMPPSAIIDSFGATLPVGKKVRTGMFPVYIMMDRGEAEAMATAIADSHRQEDLRFNREKQRNVIIYDFGDERHLGIKNIGGVRQAIPVSHMASWTGGEYGFVKGAVAVEYKKWIADAFDCDGVKCNGDTEFKLRLPARKYRLVLGLSPFSAKCNLQISINGKKILSRELGTPDRSHIMRIEEPLTIVDDNSIVSVMTSNTYCLWHYLILTEIFPE